MDFKINGTVWEIIEEENEIMLLDYNKGKEDSEKEKELLGYTNFVTHKIYLNKEACDDQKLSTLAHELTHCWLWMNAFGQVENYNYEIICDIVASCYGFINEMVDSYKAFKRL